MEIDRYDQPCKWRSRTFDVPVPPFPFKRCIPLAQCAMCQGHMSLLALPPPSHRHHIMPCTICVPLRSCDRHKNHPCTPLYKGRHKGGHHRLSATSPRRIPARKGGSRTTHAPCPSCDAPACAQNHCAPACRGSPQSHLRR